MAVAYRSGSVTSANSGAVVATQIVINVPVGVQDGDFMYANIAVAGGTGTTITPPAGWTLINRTNSGTNLGKATYYKIASGESGSYTWSHTSARDSGQIAAYTGVDANNPLAGNATKGGTTTTTFTATRPQVETAYAVLSIATRNTGSSAMTVTTPSTGYTVEGDTCSTNPVIQSAILDSHSAYTLPLSNGINPGAITMSLTTAQTQTEILFLRADISTSTGLTLDVAMMKTQSAATPIVSDAFNTGYNNELLLAFIGTASGDSVSSVTTSGVTWVRIATVTPGAGPGPIDIWRAFATTPLSNVTVSVAATSIFGFSYLQVLSFTNANTSGTNGSGAIGANSTTSGNSTNPTLSITTTANNSWVWSLFDHGSAVGTAGTGQTVESKNTSTFIWSQKQDSITPSSGTSVTSNATAASAFWAEIAIEVLVQPAAGGSVPLLPLLGVGT